ncbi:MAG: PfkB family carbohydrate kinase, partial [Limisphaerales bacterium]
MILCIGATPAAQRVMAFERLAADEVNRAAVCVDGVAGKSVNVAKVLHALGESVVATGFLGGDRGSEVADTLQSLGIQLAFVPVETRTRQCITVIDKATGAITELVEESGSVPSRDYERLLGIVRDWAPRCSALVMSGTITPGGPEDFYLRCAELA